MEYIIIEILIYLLIASVLGVVIGFILRGGCSKKVKKVEALYEEKIEELKKEQELQTKMIKSDIDEARSSLQEKEDEIEKIVQDHEDELNAIRSQKVNESKKVFAPTASLNKKSTLNLNAIQTFLSKKGVNLNTDLIELYAQNNINFEKSSNLQTIYPIEVLDGISEEYTKKLNEIGIKTTAHLLQKQVSNPENIDSLVLVLGVLPKDVIAWIAVSDLLRLPGVDEKAARLMFLSGVGSVEGLRHSNLQEVFDKSVAINNDHNIVPNIPNIGSLKLWAKIASSI